MRKRLLDAALALRSHGTPPPGRDPAACRVRPASVLHHRLRSLHRQHIKAFLLDKRREGYAKNSVRLMKAPLSVLLSDAVDDGIQPGAPARPPEGLARRQAERL